MTKLESIKKHGVSAQGRKELLRYLKGKDLTLHQAVLARCYDCMSYFADGAADCKIPECPLYPYMPFRTLRNVNKAVAKKGGTNGKGKKRAEKAPRKEEGRDKKEEREKMTGRKTGKEAEPPKKGPAKSVKGQSSAQESGAPRRKKKAPAVPLKLF